MQARDSDGGELPGSASGSCHAGLISPVTRHEAQPLTRRSFQQVMKTGRLASGWQEPGAVRRGKEREDKISCGATILDFARLRQLWIRSVRGADGRVCISYVEDVGKVCVCTVLCVPRAAPPNIVTYINLRVLHLMSCPTQTVKPHISVSKLRLFNTYAS